MQLACLLSKVSQVASIKGYRRNNTRRRPTFGTRSWAVWDLMCLAADAACATSIVGSPSRAGGTDCAQRLACVPWVVSGSWSSLGDTDNCQRLPIKVCCLVTAGQYLVLVVLGRL